MGADATPAALVWLRGSGPTLPETDAASMTPPAPATIDGRTARRDRNRTAVLDAVISLFSESNLSPGVHEVAERSGVSLRSVYRYFEDVDALIYAAIERQFEQSRELYLIEDLGVGALDERIERLVRRRIALFEDVRIVYQASVLRAGRTPAIAEGLSFSRRKLAEQVEAMFAPELARLPEAESRQLAITLDTLAQFESLQLLRSERGMSVDQCTEHLIDVFTMLLTDA